MLPQDFYLRDTVTVAQDLLGKVLCFRSSMGFVWRGRINDVEAYLGITDPASHAFRGRRTPRVRSMYLQGGHAYVYMIYGLHHCLNVVTRSEKEPEAVLIRGVELLAETSFKTNGPGKLCAVYGISKKQDGLPLFEPTSPLWIETDAQPQLAINSQHLPRVGIDYAGEAAHWPLRFTLL
jgi:DNA-3-methyladenine glycosylase